MIDIRKICTQCVRYNSVWLLITLFSRAHYQRVVKLRNNVHFGGAAIAVVDGDRNAAEFKTRVCVSSIFFRIVALRTCVTTDRRTYRHGSEARDKEKIAADEKETGEKIPENRSQTR